MTTHTSFSIDSVLAALEAVVPRADDRTVALHEPLFGGNEWRYVKDCIDTGWVSSVGAYVDRFEQMLAEFTGSRRAVAVVNGTAALHLALQLVDVRRDDEVLTPALTFIATANAISYLGAIPHFVDSEERSLGLDPSKLDAYLREIAELRNGECWNRRSGRRIRAIVPMHVFGHPLDLDAMVEVCERWQLQLVEDAAESIGSYYKGRHTGNFGRIAALSFNGNKTITTGGGGAIITNDAELGKRAKHLSTTARAPHRWSFLHDEVGYNYRLPNINAALGCAQMEQLPQFLARKRVLAERYRAAFAGVPGVRFMLEPEGTIGNYWLNAILLDGDFATQRDELLAATNSRGWQTRPVWTLLYKLPMYRDCPRMSCEVAERIEARLVNLPSSMGLVDADAAAH